MPDITIIRRMGGLVFDAVFEEMHDSELEVTDNPVETGVTVSDHAYMKPLRCTINAGVSDVALPRSPSQFDAGVSRSQEAYRLLTELQSAAEPFDVQTGLKLYRNMVCTSIRTSQNKETASSLVFTAELREVVITFTQSVTYPPRQPGPTQRQAGKTKERGEQQGKPVTNTGEGAQPAKQQSIAKSLKKALGG